MRWNLNYLCKVKTLWEGSQISTKIFFFKFCWPFQKTWTLITIYKKIPVFCFSRQKHEIQSFFFILILHASFSRVFIDVNYKRIFNKMLEARNIQVSFWLEKWKMKIGTSSFAVELHLWQSSKWSWKFSNWMSRAGWLLPKLYIPITIK